MLIQELHRLSDLFWQTSNQPTILETNPSEKVLERMELLLVDYLEEYPQDTNMWLKLIMLEFTPPWEVYDRIEKYITIVLNYDKNNIQSLLILAYAQYIYRGEISEDVFLRLQNSLNITTDKELLSMTYLAMAWYYSSKDEIEYKICLLQSIFYCNKHVKNYVRLGELYIKNGNYNEAAKMIYHAIENVSNVCKNNNNVSDLTDIDSFFDEFFKGYSYTQDELQKYITIPE